MKRFLMLSLVMILTACSGTKEAVDQSITTRSSNTKAKNVILLIGDGMGLSQITAGMIANGNRTVLEEFTITGFHKSFSYDNLITDSAAGATAFASGVKTYNGAIGVDPDTNVVETILEEAEEKGMATGLVATSTIVHATPASFIAHNKSRQNYEEIAEDFLRTEVDYFVGGGKKYFDRRKDERNLIEELKDKGYNMNDYFNQDFKELEVEGKMFGYFTADDSPLTAEQGRDYMEDATSKGISFLDQQNEKGFFMMIEGSQIDWGGHANNSDYIVTEFLSFDHTISKALDWAKKDGNTLVVVTADHETGGYSVNRGTTMDTLVTAFTTDYHTATMIPVFAYGPGAEAFSGIYENTAIYEKMRKAFGWE